MERKKRGGAGEIRAKASGSEMKKTKEVSGSEDGEKRIISSERDEKEREA